MIKSQNIQHDFKLDFEKVDYSGLYSAKYKKS